MEPTTKTNNKIKKIHPYVFPICLLKGFEEEPNKTARIINTFVYNRRKAKKGISEEDLTPYTGIDFEKYEIDIHSVYTWCDYDFLSSIAKGRKPTKKEIELFLFLCAVRSIIQHDNWKLSNWLCIAFRAAGYNSPNENIKLSGICESFTFQTKERRRRLIDEISKYKIDIYSSIGIRGFYIYQNIELIEVIRHVEETKKKNKEESARIKKIRESFYRSYKNGTLKDTINGVYGKNVYTDELGKYFCENAKTGRPDEYIKLTNNFFSFVSLSKEKINFRNRKQKNQTSSLAEVIDFMTNV